MAATDGSGKSRKRIGLVAAGLGALTATSAAGDDTIDFKLLHYRESNGRTQVTNPEIYFTHDFGEKGQLGLVLSYDSISGASPTGAAATLDATVSASSASASSIPMADYTDTRQAASLSYTKRFGSHLPTATLSWSHESDYRSTGLSLLDAWDLFGGRSTLRLGVGNSRDRIDPARMSDHFSKKSLSFSVGWTQVLGPRDLLDFSLGLDRLNGYLTDPYKLVPVPALDPNAPAGSTMAVPEIRPNSRNRMTAVLKYGHYFLSRSALKTSYRYYWDDWSVKAHMLDLTYDQRMGRRWILTPRLRLYRQGSASFFAYEFQSPQTYMSSDYRLSSFWSWLAGIGLTVNLNDHLSLNLGATYLDQTGVDRIRPKVAAPTALLGRAGAMLEEGDDGEGGGSPGLISAADMTTLTGTFGFTIKF